MKVVAISSTHDVRGLLAESQGHGYITFVYHHADPNHELLKDKFLYVHTDQELMEKVGLLKLDVTIQDLIRK